MNIETLKTLVMELNESVVAQNTADATDAIFFENKLYSRNSLARIVIRFFYHSVNLPNEVALLKPFTEVLLTYVKRTKELEVILDNLKLHTNYGIVESLIELYGNYFNLLPKEVCQVSNMEIFLKDWADIDFVLLNSSYFMKVAVEGSTDEIVSSAKYSENALKEKVALGKAYQIKDLVNDLRGLLYADEVDNYLEELTSFYKEENLDRLIYLRTLAYNGLDSTFAVEDFKREYANKYSPAFLSVIASVSKTALTTVVVMEDMLAMEKTDMLQDTVKRINDSFVVERREVEPLKGVHEFDIEMLSAMTIYLLNKGWNETHSLETVGLDAGKEFLKDVRIDEHIPSYITSGKRMTAKNFMESILVETGLTFQGYQDKVSERLGKFKDYSNSFEADGKSITSEKVLEIQEGYNLCNNRDVILPPLGSKEEYISLLTKDFANALLANNPSQSLQDFVKNMLEDLREEDVNVDYLPYNKEGYYVGPLDERIELIDYAKVNEETIISKGKVVSTVNLGKGKSGSKTGFMDTVKNNLGLITLGTVAVVGTSMYLTKDEDTTFDNSPYASEDIEERVNRELKHFRLI